MTSLCSTVNRCKATGFFKERKGKDSTGRGWKEVVQGTADRLAKGIYGTGEASQIFLMLEVMQVPLTGGFERIL
jgi:hypothetical protein